MKLEHIVVAKSKQLNSYTYGQKYSRLRWLFQKFNSLFKGEPVYEGRLKVILLQVSSHDYGGFHLVAKIIRELKSHMIPFKFKCTHWLKLQHSDWINWLQ